MSNNRDVWAVREINLAGAHDLVGIYGSAYDAGSKADELNLLEDDKMYYVQRFEVQ